MTISVLLNTLNILSENLLGKINHLICELCKDLSFSVAMIQIKNMSHILYLFETIQVAVGPGSLHYVGTKYIYILLIYTAHTHFMLTHKLCHSIFS